MKAQILIFLSLFLLISNSIEAGSINDKKGFRITPSVIPQDQMVLKNGESFTFEGDVCIVKWGIFGNETCLKVPTSKPEFKAYYPDSLHDVTDKIIITQSHDKKTWKYKFKTDELKDSDLNQFTLTVGSASKKGNDLLKIKAKLEKRILILKGFSNHYAGKPHYQRNLNYLNGLIEYLELLVSRLDAALENNPEILAQIRQPIQVENKISGSMFYSSNFSGHKITLKIPVGISFQGEKATLEASVTNLSDKSFYFPGFEDEGDDDTQVSAGDQSYKLTIELDGQNLLQSPVFSLGFGKTKTISVITGKLNPNQLNKVKTHLERSNNGKFDFISFFSRRLGSLAYDMNVVADTVAPSFINVTPSNASYHKSSPEIKAVLTDALGRIDSQSLRARLLGTTSASLVIDRDVTHMFTITSDTTKENYIISGSISDLVEGKYNLVLSGKDNAGNLTSYTINDIYFDKTAPKIFMASTGGFLTNNPEYQLNFTVLDVSAVTYDVFRNGSLIAQSSSLDFNDVIILSEGINNFEVKAVDAAGNYSNVVKISGIELDSISPILNIQPEDHSVLNSLQLTATGVSNEKLQSVNVNGVDLVLAQSKKDFSGVVSLGTEGDHVLNFNGYDLAGNMTRVTKNIKVVLAVFNRNLIAIEPTSNGSQLLIKGAPSAVRRNLEVTANAGFFNTKKVVANEDGSFNIVMNPFSKVTISANDPSINRSESFDLNYIVDTSLAGIVKDIDGVPLPGVVITIQGTNQTATTGLNGTFKISNPVTGDQKLLVDGSTIPNNVFNDLKKFSAVTYSVSIGSTQSNVIEKPIYLAPNFKDGTEVKIVNGEATTVTSIHAPGVELDIPQNSVTFPDGTKTGAISVIAVSSDRTTVAPPNFSVPEVVYALEPSGTKFSAPVQLRLPNDNEFPEGMELVILSKNSLTGEWEIDGVAKVDGNEIITKDGMGITHFSEIYASPLGPEIKEVGSNDVPGANTFGGAYSASIKMPSFKSLGQTITPELIYKSSWANPNVVVKNIFDIPRQEITKSTNGRIVTNDVVIDTEEDLTTWIEPEYIESQFFTTGLIGKKVKYTGVPRNVVVSYGMDLSSLKSGVHPYLANYGIQLKKMYLSTRKLNVTALGDAQFENGSKTLVQNKLSAGELFRSIYPTDLRAPLYIQNKKNSEVGAGWKIKGIQKLINPSDNRIMIEEADGSISTYTVENKISTILRDPTGVKAADFNSWPIISVLNNSNQIKEVDLNTLASNNIQSYTVAESVQPTTGRFVSAHGYRYNFNYNPNLGETYTMECNYKTFPFVRQRAVNSIIKAENGYYGLNGHGELFFNNNGVTNHLIGLSDTKIPKQSLVNISSSRNFTHPNTASFCQNTSGLSCGQSTDLNQNTINQVAGFFPGCHRSGPNVGDGDWYFPQFVDGASSVAALNNPVAIIFNQFKGTYVIADYGNNRVREFNTNTGVISTIVGDGRTSKEGDGGSALSAGIYHPNGIAYDSNGNLYVSTEDGYIRKVNNTGVISTLAGLPVSLGGSLEEVTTADKVALSNPAGMVVDNTRGYLYVADTGNRRVLRINLSNKIVQVIAGNGTCVTNPLSSDNKAALEASLCSPSEVGLDDDGNLLVLDKEQNAIRRIVFTSSSVGQLSYASTQQDNSTLVRNSNGKFIRTYRNGVVIEFDSSGNQLYTRDRGNRTIHFNYDSHGRLVSQVDPTGSTVQYSYSGNRLASITDPAGRTTSFNYSSGNLVEVNYPDSSSTSFDYDDKNLLTEYRDQENNLAQVEYNSLFRMTKLTDPMGNVTYFDDSDSRLAGNYVEDGERVAVQRAGLSVNDVNDKVIDPNGNISTFVEDENGYIEFIVNGEGKKTEYQRDFSGRLLKIVKPDLSYREFQYNSNGDLTAEYDSALDVTVRKEYDLFGNVLSYTNPQGVKVTNTYNTEGLLLTSTSTEGDNASQVYNEKGLVSEATSSLGSKVFYEYDDYGNMSKITNHSNNIINIARDSAGNITQRVNANGDKTTYEYDLFNRLVSITSPKLEITSIFYTLSGNISKIIDPKGNINLFSYDGNGNLILKTDANNKTTHMFYDGNKNITKIIDEGGREQLFEYNSSSKVTKRTLLDNVYIYNYNDSGNLSDIIDSKSQIIYTYNSQNQVTSVLSKGLGAESDLPSVSLTYSYDEFGNKSEMIDSTGTTRYEYNDTNNLIKITNQNNEMFEFDYNLSNNLTAISRPGSLTSIVYDPSEYLKSITHSASNGLSFYDYDRDASGNKLVKRTPSGNYDFTYDKNEQLISATNPDAQGGFGLESFSYDELGNRIESGQQYDSKKLKLTEDVNNVYTFDVYGNLTSKIEKPITSGNVTNYIYNSEKMLIGVDIFKNNILIKEVDYLYDAIGRRVKKVVVDHEQNTSKVRKYAYDGLEIIQEFNEDNELLAKYTNSSRGLDDILSISVTSRGRDEGVASSSGSYYFLKDSIGTVTDITNSSGNIVQKYVYSAFGQILKIKNGNNVDISSNPVVQVVNTFTGREYDSEIGLYYYRARYYDPSAGRFIQSDPHPGNIGNPLTYINKYVYVLNNPINATDPLGLFSVKKIFKGIVKSVKKVMSNKVAGLIISSVVGGPLGALAYVNMSGQFSQKDVALVNMAAVAAAAAATGGAAGASAGALFGGGFAGAAAGAVAGAVAGGITGGVVGGALSTLSGGSFHDGFISGAVRGMIAGALAGAAAGYYARGPADLAYNSRPGWIDNPAGGRFSACGTIVGTIYIALFLGDVDLTTPWWERSPEPIEYFSDGEGQCLNWGFV